jgi:hypothetical protein
MPAERKKASTETTAKKEEAQYAAEEYAVNDYAVPADYTVPQGYYTESGEYVEGQQPATNYTQQYDYSDPNNQYYADSNQYYYDYTTGQYVDPNAAGTDPSAAYNYDQYYSQQGYYDQSYNNTSTKGSYYNGRESGGTGGGSGAPLPEAVTAIQSAATAAASSRYNNGQTSSYNSPASQAPKVYYPSTANANNPVGPIIITKSGYAGPNAPEIPVTPVTPEAAATDIKKKGKNKTVVRAAGGEVWEDHSLEEWDDNDFRLFAGDLGNEVTEELLYKTFSKYPSLLRTRVVRDTRTMKSKGFGFISFKDPDDFVKAWREMNGELDII